MRSLVALALLLPVSLRAAEPDLQIVGMWTEDQEVDGRYLQVLTGSHGFSILFALFPLSALLDPAPGV